MTSLRLLLSLLFVSSIPFMMSCASNPAPVQQPQPITSPEQGIQSIECSFNEETAKRYLRDCETEIAPFLEKDSILRAQIEKLSKAQNITLSRQEIQLKNIILKRKQICYDWNVCGIKQEEYTRRTDELNSKLEILEFILYDHDPSSPKITLEKLAHWSGSPPPQQPENSPIAIPAKQGDSIVLTLTPEQHEKAKISAHQAKKRFEVIIRQQQRSINESHGFLDKLRELRKAISRTNINHMQQFCETEQKTVQNIRNLKNSPNSFVHSRSQVLLIRVKSICERYSRWKHPDDNIKRRIKGVFRQIDSTESELKRLIKRSLSSSHTIDDKREAKKALTTVAKIHRELKGTPDGSVPFPCKSKLWNRVEKMQWKNSTVKRRMSLLTQRSEQVCQALGITHKAVRAEYEHLEDSLDETESDTLRHIQDLEDILTSSRTNYDHFINSSPFF